MDLAHEKLKQKAMHFTGTWAQFTHRNRREFKVIMAKPNRYNIIQYIERAYGVS